MGWLSKVWAALVALFLRCFWCIFTKQEALPSHDANLRRDISHHPDLDSNAPVEIAPAAQPLAYPESHGSNLSHDIPHGSPLKVLIDQMEVAFPVPSIKPGSDMASLQYAAGQRAVVDWVRMKQKRGQA